MTRTLGALATTVRNRLDELVARQWTDVQIREWIMEGARDVARRAECLFTKQTFAISAGTAAYNLSAISPGIVRLHRVEFQPSGDTNVYPLEVRDRQAMDALWGAGQNISQSIPRAITLWGYPPGLTAQLFPVPSLAGTASLYYYALPTDLATDGTGDASIVQCPEGWEDVIADYAEYHALRKDRDDRWKDVLQAYEQRLVDLAATTIRFHDQSGWITHDTGFVPAWLVGSDMY